MAADVQVVEREVWEGRVPAVITLARDELTTLEQPRELYLMLPRQGYLPYAATREVYDHFGAHAPPCPDEVWFECDGAPLRWTVPIGVLFDQHLINHLPAADASGAAHSGVDDGSAHPWRLTAHFSNFPAAVILRGGGVRDTSTVAAHYMNTLKQSTYLRYGSTQAVMSLSTDAQRRLQRAVETGEYADYAAVQSQLLPPNATSDERRRKARAAVRVYRGSGPCLQPSVALFAENGQPHTLADVLDAALPGEGFGVASDKSAAPPNAIIHGLPAPLSAPIDWLSAACAHPDGFLHVVVRAGQEEAAGAVPPASAS